MGSTVPFVSRESIVHLSRGGGVFVSPFIDLNSELGAFALERYVAFQSSPAQLKEERCFINAMSFLFLLQEGLNRRGMSQRETMQDDAYCLRALAGAARCDEQIRDFIQLIID